MKTSFRSLLAAALICLTILIPVASFAAPELPKTRFYPELVDGAGKWYLNFETNPGYHYIVEESQNLVDWTAANGGSFYGNGVEQKMFICNGPMSTESTGTGGTPNSGEGLWQLKTISMKLQMQSGNLGSFQRLSRNSYTPLGATEPLPAWDKELTLQLPSQTARWRYFPMLEWKDYTEQIMYWVDLHVHITDEPPPVDSLATSAEEPAELEIFSKVYSALVGQLLLEGTPAPPSGPQPRTYARIRVTEIDVNGNGLWDWWELKYGWNPFAQPGQPGFCDPYGDPDGDGIPNYQEKIDGTDPTKYDSDGDGFHDGEDDFPNDKEKHPPPVTYLIVANKGIDFSPGSGGYDLHRFNNWSENGPSEYHLEAPYTSPHAMAGGLTAPEFPQNPEGATPKGTVPENGSAEASGGFYFGPGDDETPPYYGGNLSHVRLWLVHKPIETEPVTSKFLLIEKKTSSVGPMTYQAEPVVVSLTVSQGATLSVPYDLVPDFSGIALSEAGYTVMTQKDLVSVNIEPDADMAGVVGDVVKSVVPGSTIKHFVSPKKSTDLSQDYIIFKATGVTVEQISPSHEKQIVEWDGGEAMVPADPLRRRVKRDAAGRNEVKIRLKGGGTVLQQMNVWIVWADIVLNQTKQATLNPVNVITPNPPGLNTTGASVLTEWNMEATIQPPTIITDAERPDFSGAPKADVPNKNAKHANDGEPFGQPAGKWDFSRQMRCRILSPLIGTGDLYDLKGLMRGTLYDNLPNANIIQPTTPNPGADAYPQDKLEGNDDSGSQFEDNDPYSQPAIGKLTDQDTPEHPFVNDDSPAVGSDIDFRMQFLQFCRLEVGGKWFLISDQKPWRLHGKLKKTWIAAEDDTDGNGVANGIEGQIRDNGSISDATNNGW